MLTLFLEEVLDLESLEIGFFSLKKSSKILLDSKETKDGRRDTQKSDWENRRFLIAALKGSGFG